MPRSIHALVLAVIASLPSFALAQDQADLAKQSQNPVADLISLPFQNNTFFGIGPDDDTANVLNIQPVIPINLGPVNLINRTIVPLIYLPDLTSGLPELPEGVSGGSTFGLGDINYTGWLSPVGGARPRCRLPRAADGGGDPRAPRESAGRLPSAGSARSARRARWRQRASALQDDPRVPGAAGHSQDRAPGHRPAGETRDGLPVGLGLEAAPGADRRLFEIGLALEAVLPAAGHPPDL